MRAASNPFELLSMNSNELATFSKDVCSKKVEVKGNKKVEQPKKKVDPPLTKVQVKEVLGDSVSDEWVNAIVRRSKSDKWFSVRQFMDFERVDSEFKRFMECHKNDDQWLAETICYDVAWDSEEDLIFDKLDAYIKKIRYPLGKNQRGKKVKEN